MSGQRAARWFLGPVLALALVGGLPGRAAAQSGTSAPAPKGVTIRVETSSGDVEVVGHREQKVVVEAEEAEEGSVKLVPRDKNTLEVTFEGRGSFASGGVRLRVPAGSILDVRTQSGDVRMRDLGGEARVRTLSGDISVTGAVGAALHTVSGDLRVEGAGVTRAKTVSGDVDVRELRAGSAITVDLESTSGDLHWSGTCGAGCRLTAASVSGDVVLALDARSSFRLTQQSHSGELQDGLGLQTIRAADRRRGSDVEARYGKGEGSIDCRTFSGDARLSKR